MIVEVVPCTCNSKTSNISISGQLFVPSDAAPGGDDGGEAAPPQSSSFIPSWLRSKLPAAIGGSREYEEEVEQLTMDSAPSQLSV